MRSKLALLGAIGTALLLGGCFDSDDDQSRMGGGNADLNQAPTITGSPPPGILVGELYEFTPVASDADGDTLEFTIARKPSWASFNRATGHLSGTPSAVDVGNFTNISISVSDGAATAALTNFDITVNQIAAGQVTLSWSPPTENVNGSSLTDLSGYKIYYGRSASSLTQTIELSNPGLTRYVVENLSPANWHFAMSSVNSQGVESTRSATVSKTIG
jgi:hypothetical protein